MNEENIQYQLGPELQNRLEWYFHIREKTFKQINFSPVSIRSAMWDLIRYLDSTAIPIVRNLIETVGHWQRDDAVEFYNANNEVCRLTDEISMMGLHEDRAVFAKPHF